MKEELDRKRETKWILLIRREKENYRDFIKKIFGLVKNLFPFSPGVTGTGPRKIRLGTVGK